MDGVKIAIIVVSLLIVGLIIWAVWPTKKIKGCMDDKYVEYNADATKDTDPTSCLTLLEGDPEPGPDGDGGDGGDGGEIKADAMVQNSTSDKTYYFVGTDFYEEDSDGTISGPKNIKEIFGENTPEFMDAAVYNGDTKDYYFFKGDQVFKKKEGIPTQEGYQYNIDGEFGLLTPTNMDSAVYKHHDYLPDTPAHYHNYFFFKGDTYWKKSFGADEETQNPKSIRSIWGDDLADIGNINAASYNDKNWKLNPKHPERNRGTYTFSHGDNYYLRHVGGVIDMAEYPKSLTTLLIST